MLHFEHRLARLRRASRNGNVLRRAEFNAVKKELHSNIKTAKDFLYTITLPNMVKKNPWKFWSSISSHQSTTNTFILGEIPTSEPQVIANYLKEYFTSVFT